MNASRHPLYGVMLSLGAVLLFAGQDGIAKSLSLVYPALLVVWARFVVQTLLMTVAYAPSMGLSILRTRRWRVQLLRGLCMLAASLCFVGGLRYVPVGEATAVVYLSPLLVVTYSARVLRERIGLGQWAAAICGFVGVLMIVRPGSALFTPAVLFPIGASGALAAYQVLTRQVLEVDNPVASNFITSVICLAILSALVPLFWVTPTLGACLLVAAQGAMAMTGHMLLTYAYRNTSVARLAPFTYAQIVFASLIGFLFFGHVPDQATLAGMGVIILSGLGLVLWQRR